jgi:hypothetical protein
MSAGSCSQSPSTAHVVTRVISMGRRNTQLEPNLALKTKAEIGSLGLDQRTLPWLGFDRGQPNTSLFPGKHCRINALDGVASTG